MSRHTVNPETLQQFPEVHEFAIDKPRLRRYWRLQALLGWGLAALFFGTLLGMCHAIDAYQNNLISDLSSAIWLTCQGTGIALAIGLACYISLSHIAINRMSDNLQLVIEGAFLRIRSGAFLIRDRKIHFHALIDFAIVEGSLMRHCKISALHMHTTGAGAHSIITVPGIHDVSQARELLCHIDRQREDRRV